MQAFGATGPSRAQVSSPASDALARSGVTLELAACRSLGFACEPLHDERQVMYGMIHREGRHLAPPNELGLRGGLPNADYRIAQRSPVVSATYRHDGAAATPSGANGAS